LIALAMRVAIFSEVYWPMVSGVSRALERLLLELHAHGHQARVYSATYPLPPGTPDRPEVHRSPSTPLFLSPEVQWAFPRRREILEDLAGFSPDVIHLATEFAMGLTGLRCARALSLPIVASSHTDYERYAARYGVEWALRPGWSYLRWFYGHAARVLCPSGGYEAHLHARGIHHTGTWSRGVDPDVFHPDTGPRHSELGSGRSRAIPWSPTWVEWVRRKALACCWTPGDCWRTSGRRRGWFSWAGDSWSRKSPAGAFATSG